MADGDVINQREEAEAGTVTLTESNSSTLFFATWFPPTVGGRATIVDTLWFNSVPATLTFSSWDASLTRMVSPFTRDGLTEVVIQTWATSTFNNIPVEISGSLITPVIKGATVIGLRSTTAAATSTTSNTLTSSAITGTSSSGVLTPTAAATVLTSGSLSSGTSTSSSAVSTSTASSSKSGVSNGAAAGIGIGCATAGALIAFALLFFCMRKRGSRRGTLAADGVGGYAAPTARSPDEKIPLTRVGAFGGAGIGAFVENNLPQPVEDQAIVESLSKLRSSIKNHVQSFYHSSPTNVGDINQEALEALGDELPMPSSMLRLQLSDQGSRNAALRFCIAFAIISRLGFRSSPSDTLLPPEVAGCFQSMRGMKTNVKVRDAFLSRWRAITSTLIQPTYGSNAFPVSDTRSRNINKLLDLLDSVLYPFASNSQDSFQRRKNLEEILKRAAGVAFLLFSQPSAWQFEWEDARAREPGSLVVFPALLQTVDETGRSLNPPQAFTQIEVSR